VFGIFDNQEIASACAATMDRALVVSVHD
jgi:hypothetical protein